MVSAFTSKFPGLSNKLINDVDVIYNGKSIRCKALWDTGATSCCVSKALVRELSLIPTGKVSISTPNKVSERDTYLVDICLPNTVMVKDVMVIDSDIDRQNIGMLIGMNIISLGDFTVSNYQNKTVFTFRIPSVSPTDYVKQIHFSNVLGPKHGTPRHKKKK